MHFEVLNLDGEYKELIGTPSKNFIALVYGKPGSGKTTFCIKFAKYLCTKGMKILFATKEEGFNHTFKEKINRMDAAHPNFHISPVLDESIIKNYDAVFIDSVTSFKIQPHELVEIKERNPNTAFIYIFQATKGGDFRGALEYLHDADVEIKAENGILKTEGKNRFGHSGEMKVY